MEQELGMESTAADAASAVYLGQWNGLISTTNWEKGHIICEWREALIASGASLAQYSDEAWSRRVGNVSGQHVGRLRRVAERFFAVRNEYAGLYWSHFQAALDWNDAEMWLEGAVQSDWSVSEMRRQRWEAFGGGEDQKPRDEEIVTAELDEDYTPPTVGQIGEVHAADGESGEPADYSSDETFQPDWGDEGAASHEGVPFDSEGAMGQPFDAGPAVRPFENLADLPADLTDAFESFKLAILRHKLAGWQEVSRDDVLSSLDALKQLALAPAE